LPSGESEPVVALRRQRLRDDDGDGMLLVVGGHFNYIKVTLWQVAVTSIRMPHHW
jgi:hypothetical protein